MANRCHNVLAVDKQDVDVAPLTEYVRSENEMLDLKRILPGSKWRADRIVIDRASDQEIRFRLDTWSTPPEQVIKVLSAKSVYPHTWMISLSGPTAVCQKAASGEYSRRCP